MARWSKNNRQLITINLESVEQHEQWTDYADDLGVNMSALIRTAMENLLKEYPTPRYFQVPLLPEGDKPQDFGIFDHTPDDGDDFIDSYRRRSEAEQRVLQLNGMVK